MAKSFFDLFNPFTDPRESGPVRRMREKAERQQQLQRQAATQQALAEQVAPEKSLVVPREPWNNEPIMSGPEWAVLPREAQVQKIRENELERVRMDRRKAEWKSPTKLPQPTREESIQSIMESIGQLQQVAREPWEGYIEDTPHLAMRDRKLTMGMNVSAAQKHNYKFLTDPEYRKKIWALPRDLQHPAESGRRIPHAKYSTPALASERDVKFEKAKEWWQKATPLKGLFAGEELAEMQEIREKIAGKTATDDDIWKMGYYRARLQIADEKGLLGKTADSIRDMVGYMGEISLVGGPVGGRAALGTKNLAAGLLKRAPSVAGRKVIGAAADIGVGGLVQGVLTPGSMYENVRAQLGGRLDFRPDERGRLEVYMERDARTTGRKVLDGVLSHVMEQSLERAGGHAMGAIAGTGKGLYKGVEKGFVKAGIIKMPGNLAKNTGKMAMAGHLLGKHSKLPGKIGGILTGKRLGAVMKQGGWNGVLPEMLEEMGTAFFEQYINPEHFLSTGKENQWTMIRDWASGAKDAKGNTKYTGGEVAKELAPMVLSFITIGAFGAGGRGLTSYLQKGRAEFAAPELPEFALEEGRWKDLVLGEGKESAATFVNRLEGHLLDSARAGAPGKAMDQIRALIELAHAEQAAPSDQNVSRSTFEKIKVPNTDISLYQLLKKKADRKGFLDGLVDHSERLLELGQAVQRATTAESPTKLGLDSMLGTIGERQLAEKLRSAAQEGFQTAQDEAGRPVHVGGQPAATVGPRGEPLSVIGEPSLGQIPEEAQAEAGVPTMSGLPPTVIGPEGQTLVDPLVRADRGQAPVQPAVEAPAEAPAEAPVEPPVDVPAAPAVQQDVPAAPTIDAEAGVNVQVAADLRAEAEELKKGPKRWALEKAAAAIEAHPEEVTRDLKPGVIPGVGQGVVKRVLSTLVKMQPDDLGGEMPRGQVGGKLTPTDEQRRERAAQRKAEAEAKAKRGEPVAAEPAAPKAAGKGVANLVPDVAEDIRQVVGLAGLFGGASAENAAAKQFMQHPITELYRDSARPVKGRARKIGDTAWVERLEKGDFSDTWDSPESFFREFDAAIKTLEAMEQGTKGRRSEDDLSLSKSLKDSGVIHEGDTPRLSVERLLGNMKGILKSKDKRYDAFRAGMEKALAEPAPTTPAAPEAAEEDMSEEERHEFYRANAGAVQRQEPEQAMVKFREAAGHGPLAYLAEHGGDTVHRMYAPGDDGAGKIRIALGVLGEITDKSLTVLEDHAKSQSQLEGISLEEWTERHDAALADYTEAWRAMPAYNEVQELARDAMVAVGEKDFDTALSHFEKLQSYVNEGEKAWYKKRMEAPAAPTAAEDIGQEERDLERTPPVRDPKIKEGEYIPPGGDKPEPYVEVVEPPLSPTEALEQYHKDYEKALDEKPYESVHQPGKKPKIQTIVNKIAEYFRPELKGEELEAYKTMVLGVAREIQEQLNTDFDNAALIEGSVGDLAPYRREARRIAKKGRKRVEVKGEVGPRGGKVYTVKDLDSGDIKGIDTLLQGILLMSGGAHTAAGEEGGIGEMILGGNTTDDLYQFLLQKPVHYKLSSAEVEDQTMKYLLQADSPSWAPEQPPALQRSSKLSDTVVTGVPSREGMEEGESIPRLVTGKVIADEADYVIVEVDDGEGKREYEVSRQELELHNDSKGRSYEFEDDSGTFKYDTSAFGVPFMLGTVDPTVGLAAAATLIAAKQFHSWISDTTGIRQQGLKDLATDLTRVGGLFGKETWQKIQDAEAEVRAIQHEISRGFAELDAAIKRSRWKKRLPGLGATLTQRLKRSHRDALNAALDIAPDKLEDKIGIEKGQLDIPRELLGPIKRISAIQQQLSESVAETLPELMKDPEFVKKYDSKKLVQVVIGEDMVHIHRGYLAFENPNWGKYVRKHYPDLVEKFRGELKKVLREEQIQIVEDKRYNEAAKKHAAQPHHKAILRELKKLKTEKKQGRLFDKDRAQQLTKQLSEDLNVLREQAKADATAIIDGEIERGELLTDAQLDGKVEGYLSPGKVDPRVRTSLGRMDMRMFLARKLGSAEYHKLLRAVLGEVREPRARMLRSAELLASYLQQRSLQHYLYKEGIEKGWFLDPVKKQRHEKAGKPLIGSRHYTEELPNALEYGPLAGLRTTKEFKRAMARVFGQDLPVGHSRGQIATQAMYRTWMKSVAFGKASKTIMNWPTQSMNAITNVAIEFVHGGIPMNPVKVWEAFGAAWRSARHGEPFGLVRARNKLAKAKDSKEKARLQEVVDEMEAAFQKKYRSVVADRIKRGIYFDSPIKELDDVVRLATNGDIDMFTAIPEAFEQKTTILPKSLRLLRRGVSKYWNAHAGLYRMGDDVFKGYADVTTIDMLNKAYPPSHPRWEGKTPEQRREEIKKESALRIRDRFPTSSMTPEALQFLRKWPVHGTFPTWLSEFGRTQYIEFFRKDGWLQKDWRSGNRRLRIHAIGRYARWTLMHVGANWGMKLMLRAITDLIPGFEPVDDPEKEAVLRTGAAPWDRWKDLLFVEKVGPDGKKTWTYANLSRVNPYTRIADTWRAITGHGTWLTRLGRGIDTAAGEMFSMDMIAGRLFHVASNQKPTGGKVFDDEATFERKSRQILEYLWSAFKPGEWESVRRLGGVSPWKAPHMFGGIAGDYFRGWGQPDRAGREYNVLVELLAVIAPRVGIMRPRLSVGIRVSDVGGKLAGVKSTLWKTGTNEGWANQEDFEKELKGAAYRRNLHYRELARLIRFGHATEIPVNELRDTVLRTLRFDHVDKKVARRIVTEAIAGKVFVPPLKMSNAMETKVKRGSGGKEMMRYFNSRVWETNRSPTKPKIRK